MLLVGMLTEKSLKRGNWEKKQNNNHYDESHSQTGKSSTAKWCGAKTKTTAATKPAFVCAVWLFHRFPPLFFKEIPSNPH